MPPATDPWLSILMPVYNGAATLRATLESVAPQSEGIELILVDQASTDDSLEIARAFQGDIGIELVPAPENRNWVQNTNKALALARAPRACLLHQDDIWRPGRAALLRRMFAAEPDATLWLHGADYIDETGATVGRISPPFGPRARSIATAEALGHLLVQNTLALPAAAFPTEAARRLKGLDETLWYTADWDFWLGLARQGRVFWSPERAAAFRLHRGSLTISGSRDLDDFAAQMEAPLLRHADALPADRRKRVMAAARASNRVNLWLASVFHDQRRPLRPVLGALLRLGPIGLARFLRDSRILARAIPRMRLRR